MPKILIYTTQLCPYCHMAKDLLVSKGAAFDEIDVNSRPGLRDEMRTAAGGRYTVPQIWVGDCHVGGCDDLYALDRDGALDNLLAG